MLNLNYNSLICGGRKFTPITTPWILATGVWNDHGIWIDTSLWID